MDILGLRDEDDYERVLSKEKNSGGASFLQIFGTFKIENDSSTKPSQTSSTCSVITSSDASPSICLFIGSIPYQVQTKHSDTILQTESFDSVVLEQDCRYFSTEKLCYRTPWRSHLTTTSFTPTDGSSSGSSLLSEPDYTTSFVLKWTRMKSPSLKKWSRDVQQIGDSSPGFLQLSLPVIYTMSRSNVQSIYTLLDKNIELLIHQRRIIQRSLEA